MQRLTITPRPNWQAAVEKIGFSFHSMDDLYWDETACYTFSMDEVLKIETATATLWDMCLEAAQYVINNRLYAAFHIPQWFVPQIEKSWEADAPSVYGRFDFTFKNGIPKLLEFNADTPTSLFESSVVQWYWLQDFKPQKDQFNSIHEKLVAHWKYLKKYLHKYPVHFAAVSENTEDFITTEYLRDCAIQAKLETKFIDLKDIGWDSEYGIFTDLDDYEIKNLFKLYPYEWLVHEDFGKNILTDDNKAFWLEPAWKMILSNKALLPILWKLFPRHDNLLETYFEEDKHKVGTSYVKKPLLSREGANIEIVEHGRRLEQTTGDYGEEGYIYQEYCPLPAFDGNYPLVGSWLIGQEPAGMGIRESSSLITNNKSRFVPHLIL